MIIEPGCGTKSSASLSATRWQAWCSRRNSACECRFSQSVLHVGHTADPATRRTAFGLPSLKVGVLRLGYIGNLCL